MFRRFKKILLDIKINKLKNQLGKCGNNVTLSMPLSVAYPNNLILSDNIYIGSHAWISCYAKVSFGEGVIVGPRLKIYTGNHNYENPIAIPYDNLTIAKQVVIEENVWIGGDVIILPGVIIGEGAIIGAGAVVTKNVPKCAVVGGNPARILKKRNEENYYKLKKERKIYLKLKKEGKLTPYFEER